MRSWTGLLIVLVLFTIVFGLLDFIGKRNALRTLAVLRLL